MPKMIQFTQYIDVRTNTMDTEGFFTRDKESDRMYLIDKDGIWLDT